MKQFRDSKYFITEDGKVWSSITNRFLKPFKTKTGYFALKLGANSKAFSIHRLVAEIYCEGFDLSLDVNHKDGNKLNNHYTNLEWCTRSHNIQHAYDTGLSKRRIGHKTSVGSKNSMAKVTEQLVREIRAKYQTGNYTYKQIADELNLNQATIGYIVIRHTWKHVE